MAARFVTLDYDTPLLLPPNLRDWVPADHRAHFILEVVQELDLRQIRVNERGTGSEQYPSRMMLALLLSCYLLVGCQMPRLSHGATPATGVRVLSVINDELYLP